MIVQHNIHRRQSRDGHTGLWYSLYSILLAPRGLLLVLAAGLGLLASSARAVTPETGIYYDSRRPGLGYYVEVQGTTVVMLTFAFGQTSDKPVFYWASGQMTQSEPRYSQVIDPPIKNRWEYAYQIEAPLYEFELGPCLTCAVRTQDTSQHAKSVGHVFLRFADENNMFIGFQMNDGKNIGSDVQRMGFGRLGFNIRHPFYFKDGQMVTYSTPLPSFIGEWVFTDPAKPEGPPLRFRFEEVKWPLSGHYLSPDYLAGFYGEYVQFIDSANDATLTCGDIGCELVVDGKSSLVIKFWDIGMDRVLGYSGYLLTDDASGPTYRGNHLITGVRITDPIPDAPPPPTE